MPTAWQLLMKKLFPEPPKSKQVLNPFNAKIGSSIQFDVLDYRKLNFFVKEIHEAEREINGKNHPFVDYILLARPIEGSDVWAKLRLIPRQVSDTFKASDPTLVDLTHNTILLCKDDEFGFNQDFRDLLDDDEFVTMQDGKETGKFWRINDLKTSYNCCLKVVDESNESSSKSAYGSNVELWDYWREYKDEANQTAKEYLFVEMDKDNGFFALWKGKEIHPARVSVI